MQVNVLKVLVIFSFLLTAVSLNAQLTGTYLLRDIQQNRAAGNITITQDENITKVIDKHLYEEGKRKGIIGFRIRIFSNSGPQARNEGAMIEAGFISRYPDIRTDYVFDSPFYLLYVGDFRTHSEAMKFLKEIEKYYPDAFIVRSRIRYPKL